MMMRNVRAKKHLGQHFLKDPAIASDIVAALHRKDDYSCILEVGPGMGILTDFLINLKDHKVSLIELDSEAVSFLHEKYPITKLNIIEGDFLKIDLQSVFNEPFAVIGNFPYNISTQILFRILDHRNMVPEVVGMFQKEVAERIASGPGSRDYGILSVLMQVYYQVELLFTLNQEDFSPPPKVKSAVLRFDRKENFRLQCDESLFRRVVKTAFNQRRKKLRNALSPLIGKEGNETVPFLDLRAENLSWKQYEELTNRIASLGKTESDRPS